MILFILIKLIRKLFLVIPLITVLLLFKVVAVNGASESKTIQLPISNLTEQEKSVTTMSVNALPKPYDYLLTQPLMTKAIEQYYGRTAIIKTLSAQLDKSNSTYHRSILMLIDSNKERNKPDSAQAKNEATIVELAFITMNFSSLPQKIRDGVLNTHISFGTLLKQNHVQILTQDRNYFTVGCNRSFASLIQCHLNDKLYGRTNTIVRADNKKWLAHVVEILPDNHEHHL
ncbi:MAG: hypothetical protein ACRCXC_10430 [Legionella sp.]